MTKKKSKRFLSFLLAFAMVFTTCIFAGMPITTKAAVSGNTLRVDENGDFKILQIADVQGCYPLPDQWINTIRLAVSLAQPDLIVMTGDNVVSNEYSEGVWHTWDQIVEQFVDNSGNPIPFAVTFGNHDTESNGHNWISQDYYYYLKEGRYDNNARNRTVAKGAKGYYNDNEDFNGYTNFVDYDKSSTISGLTTMGTGYIDVYDPTGTTVVERVILINSGTYTDNGGYGQPGYNTYSPYNNNTAYTNLCNAVNSWTSNADIKCIAFQHIPLREFYKGDSSTTSILTRATTQASSSYIKGYGAVNDSTITSGYYAPNGTNPTVSGIYKETCCCSYGDTIGLYNALAKPNVYGIFYGHDHGNTLTGVSTIGGKSLRQGYGGGINTQWNGAGVSMFSYYNLNAAYSGTSDTENFKKTSDNYTAYLNRLGASYGPKTYAPSSVQYIRQLGVEYAPHNIFQPRTFQQALDNLGSSYTPLRNMYNDSSADADLNKTTGADTDDICIGYKTTNNPADAITGIIGYRTESGSHPSQITVTLQNGYNVIYYLEDNDVDCSGGISDYYTLIYYTKDPKAGPPITNLFMTYDNSKNSWSRYDVKFNDNIAGSTNPQGSIGDYKVCSWVEDDLSLLKEWEAFDFNVGCGGGTAYLYLEYSSRGTEDVTRKYYDIINAFEEYGHVQDSNYQIYTQQSYDSYNAARLECSAFITALNSPYSPYDNEQIQQMLENLIDAYNHLVKHPDGNGKQVNVQGSTFVDYKVAVPETIYLTPNTSESTLGQYYINNKIDGNGNLVPDGTNSNTGKFELTCPDARHVSVNVVRMGNGNPTFDFNNVGYNTGSNLVVRGNITEGTGKGNGSSAQPVGNTGVIYSWADEVEPDANGKIAGTITETNLGNAGLTPGQTGMLEWRFTITRANYEEETVYAYTTVYAPYTGVVATGMLGRYKSSYSGRANIENITSWVTGIHSMTDAGGAYYKVNNDKGSATGAYDKVILCDNSVTTKSLGRNDNAGTGYLCYTSGNGGIGYYGAVENDANGHTEGPYGFLAYGPYVGNLAVDSSRYTNVGQVPNFRVGLDLHEVWCGETSDQCQIGYGISTGTAPNGTTQTADWTNCYTDYSNFSGTKNGRREKTDLYNLSVLNMPSSETVYYVRGRAYIDPASSGELDGWANAYVRFKVTPNSKAELRQRIGQYERLAPQIEWYNNETTFKNFYSALAAASQKLGNPAYVVTNTDFNTLGNAYNALIQAERRSGLVNGVETKFFTLEENFGLQGAFNGFERTGYSVVDPSLVDMFRYEGLDVTGDNIPDGISARDSLMVKPWNLSESRYTYIGWMDGEGYTEGYDNNWTGADAPVRIAGQAMSYAERNALYQDFNVNTQTNYGHLTASLIQARANEFYFYYVKPEHTLTFDVNGGSFTYNGATRTAWSVVGMEDDVFEIHIIPTRSGYIFDGWELITSNGTYDATTKTFTYGMGNDTLRAIWLKKSTLNIDSTTGRTDNNLLYFKDGLSTGSLNSSVYNFNGSYEADSDMTLDGNIIGSTGEGTVLFDTLQIYLKQGQTYRLSYTCTNADTDFYIYNSLTGMYNGCRTGRMRCETPNGDGTYNCNRVFTVGGVAGSGNGYDDTDRDWTTTQPITGVYHFRMSYRNNSPSCDFTITDLRIVEVTESAGVDNKIVQLENSSRVIQNPPRRSDGWIFDGWTLTGGGSIAPNTIGCYTYTYANTDGTLTANWVKPIGVALDNMFNFYEFRYNDYSNKLNHQQNNTISFDNINQSFTIRNIAPESSYDTYTNYAANPNYYYVPLPKYENNGTLTTYAYYRLTMDVNVRSGSGQFFVFGYDSDKNIITSDTNKATGAVYSNSNAVLDAQRPITGSAYHVDRIFPVTNRTAYLQFRFGIYAQNSDVTFSNIRLVPLNASTVANDTLGYANKITPATLTLNTAEGNSLGNELYRPTREGYAYVGWNTNLDGTGEVFRGTTIITGNKNVWSNWSADEYILQYDKNTSDAVANMPQNNKQGAPSPTSWTLIYDKATVATSDGVISAAKPTNSVNGNKLFIGWNTSPDGTGTAFYPNVNVTRATINSWYNDAQQSVSGEDIARTKTLYAQWFDVTNAVNDAARKTGDLAQATEVVVRGISVNNSGAYVNTLQEQNSITKFDSTKHSEYTNAVDAFNTAKANVVANVTASTVSALTTTTPLVSTTAGVLEANQTNVKADYYDNFVVRQPNGTEQQYHLSNMNLNHYETATLNDAKDAKISGKAAAYKEDGSTLRLAFSDPNPTSTAQATVNAAVEKMAKAFVDKKQLAQSPAPTFSVYETNEALTKAQADGISVTGDVTGVNFVLTDAGSYTYYMYTNKQNPKIVVSVDDIAASGSNRVCYPTTAEITYNSTGNANTAKVNTQSVSNTTFNNYVKASYQSYIDNGIGTATVGNYDYYKQRDVITLNPTLTAARQEAVYKFKAHDDSLNQTKAVKSALLSGNDLVNGTNSVNLANTASDNEVTVIVSYKAADGFEVTGSQWSNGTNYDQYLNQYHLWRTSGGANNWEIHGWDAASVTDKNTHASDKNYAKPINKYAIEDEIFDTNVNLPNCNFNSFYYIFKVGAGGNSKCQIPSTNLADVRNFIKTNFNSLVPFTHTRESSGETAGLGYKAWSGSDGWAPNLYPQSNSYAYVHLIDRWGNVVDKVFEIQLIDPIAIQTSSTGAGLVLIEESGGSGIDTASINASSFEIITDENSTLVDNVYRTAGNTVLLNTGAANSSYTLTLNDRATNKTTSTVKSDENGNILLTVEDDEYTDGIYTFSLNGFEINLYDPSMTPAKGRVVDVQYESIIGTSNTFNVKVEDRANMLQFIELDKGNGTGTRSFDRYHDNVTIVSYDAQGNVVSSTSKDMAYEIWTVETPLADGNIGVRVKRSGSNVWEDRELSYTFNNEYAEAQSGLITAELARTEGASGAVGFTAVTGPDVKYVQLKTQDGRTVTVSAAKAKANEDGTLTFTGKAWIYATGTVTVRILDAYGWKDAATLEYVIK